VHVAKIMLLLLLLLLLCFFVFYVLQKTLGVAIWATTYWEVLAFSPKQNRKSKK